MNTYSIGVKKVAICIYWPCSLIPYMCVILFLCATLSLGFPPYIQTNSSELKSLAHCFILVCDSLRSAHCVSFEIQRFCHFIFVFIPNSIQHIVKYLLTFCVFNFSIFCFCQFCVFNIYTYILNIYRSFFSLWFLRVEFSISRAFFDDLKKIH